MKRSAVGNRCCPGVVGGGGTSPKADENVIDSGKCPDRLHFFYHSFQLAYASVVVVPPVDDRDQAVADHCRIPTKTQSQ